MMPVGTLVTPWHPESMSQFHAQGMTTFDGMGAGAGTAWPAANRAVYIPFRTSEPLRVTRLFYYAITAGVANVDMGLYDAAGRRLVSTGSKASVGGYTFKTETVDVTLGPGLFYFGMAASATSFQPGAGGATALYGCRLEESALPLPATATFAAITSAYIPFMGLLVWPRVLI